MAKRRAKKYGEMDLVELFQLERLVGNNDHPLMQEWMNCSIELNEHEQYVFDIITKDVGKKIATWNEETLKMNFIAHVIFLGNLRDNGRYRVFYESNLQAEVDGIFLSIKSDMCIATGIGETPKIPYFYFQEYKKVKEPYGDVTAQLIEAFLIAKKLNNIQRPLYGCTVEGDDWHFYTIEGNAYCQSISYDSTDKNGLLKIIAILRKFKEILETKLLDI